MMAPASMPGKKAAPFYRALGYQDSATYLRKVLAGKPG